MNFIYIEKLTNDELDKKLHLYLELYLHRKPNTA